MRGQAKNVVASLAIAVLVSVFAATEVRAVEIELRAVCQPTGRVVTLGDLAQIYAADQTVRDSLMAIEMFPAPAAGQKKVVRAREIQDLLVMRGLKSAENRLSGASEVEVSVPVAPAARVSSIKATTPTMERRANETVRSAIQTYLVAQTKHDELLDVKFDLDDSLIRALDVAKYRVHVRGGSSPWTGSQQLQLTVVGATQSDTFIVDAQISVPPSVVVAARSIPAGTVVNESDVKLERGKAGDGDDSVFSRLEDVVGQEVTRATGIGQPIDRDSVERPRLVKQGDAVTVYARSAGLRVRTVARAREDGAEGDLITLESVTNRQTFFARVTGNQEVEIYARAPDTSSAR